MNAGTCSVYAFLRNPSMVDFSGHLAAVFFVSGCNFRCGFCHNAELLQQKKTGMETGKLEDACSAFRDDWVDAAVLTGGEPTLAPDLPEVLTLFRRYGWAVKLDTNGSRPDVLRTCLPLVDYVAMDVKAGPSAYAGLTGYDDIAAIRESIDLIRREARDYEFRTTVISTVHDEAQMREIADLVGGARRHVLQPFVPKDDLPDPALRTVPRTPPDRLKELAAILEGSAGEILTRSA